MFRETSSASHQDESVVDGWFVRWTLKRVWLGERSGQELRGSGVIQQERGMRERSYDVARGSISSEGYKYSNAS